MALDEADRDDLMRDAVSLVRRIECRSLSRREPIVAGFNALGWLFVYLGNDPMYRFDERGRLRRAFVDGLLFRTEGHTLAMMDRHRQRESNESGGGPETTLLRRDLSPDELESFRRRMRRELEEVCEGIHNGKLTRWHPADVVGIADDIDRGLRLVLEARDFLAPAIVRR